MKNESDVKKEIKKVLKRLGAWYFMPVQTGFGVQGIPDFIVCISGKFVGIEAKFGNNKESAWQIRQGAAIADANGVYLVIYETDLVYMETMLEAVAVL